MNIFILLFGLILIFEFEFDCGCPIAVCVCAVSDCSIVHQPEHANIMDCMCARLAYMPSRTIGPMDIVYSWDKHVIGAVRIHTHTHTIQTLHLNSEMLIIMTTSHKYNKRYLMNEWNEQQNYNNNKIIKNDLPTVGCWPADTSRMHTCLVCGPFMAPSDLSCVCAILMERN